MSGEWLHAVRRRGARWLMLKARLNEEEVNRMVEKERADELTKADVFDRKSTRSEMIRCDAPNMDQKNVNSSSSTRMQTKVPMMVMFIHLKMKDINSSESDDFAVTGFHFLSAREKY